MNCTKCSSSLANIYRYLHEILKDVKVSLIVVIRGVNHRQINDINEEKKVRFAFIEDDAPLSLDDCQIIDGNEGDALKNFSKTSVLFVSISFIILMVISLAWLVFYYIQRLVILFAKLIAIESVEGPSVFLFCK